MRLRAAALALLVSLASCGGGGTEPPAEVTEAACRAEAANAVGTRNLAVNVLLLPGRAAISGSAVTTFVNNPKLEGTLAVIATYGAERYRELVRIAVVGSGNNDYFRKAQLALARKCLAMLGAIDLAGLPEGAHGDSLTAVALAFEDARRVTLDRSVAHVVVYGAGTLVTSGLDLAAADLSGLQHVEGIVTALMQNDLLKVGGGPRSSLRFGGLDEEAANAIAARQREGLFRRLCDNVDVGSCATARGVTT